MRFRDIGGTGISVSIVALGCWALAGGTNWGKQDESDSVKAIRAALDEGINFFDTAEAYGGGYSEELLAKGTAGRRHEIVIASKASPENHSAASLVEACERSLRRLRTDYIDIYQLHWPSRNVPFDKTANALKRLVKDGKIRCAGLSNFGVQDTGEISGLGVFVTNQLPYSLLWRAVEFEVAGECADRGLSILPYSPLAQGLLTGKFRTAAEVPEARARTRLFSGERPEARHGEKGCEDEVFLALARIREICSRSGITMADAAIAWLLAKECVVSVLAGARNTDQVRANARASIISLDESTVQELDEATQTIKEMIGPCPDMWESKETSRIR